MLYVHAHRSAEIAFDSVALDLFADGSLFLRCQARRLLAKVDARGLEDSVRTGTADTKNGGERYFQAFVVGKCDACDTHSIDSMKLTLALFVAWSLARIATNDPQIAPAVHYPALRTHFLN